MNKKLIGAVLSTLAFGTMTIARAEDKPADAKGEKGKKAEKGKKGDKAEKSCSGEKGCNGKK